MTLKVLLWDAGTCGVPSPYMGLVRRRVILNQGSFPWPPVDFGAVALRAWTRVILDEEAKGEP